MGIKRLAAASAVSGAVLLSLAVPASADGPLQPKGPSDEPRTDARPAPKLRVADAPTINATPNPFTPGQELTVTAKGCDTEPVLGKTNDIFGDNAPGTFEKGAKPGEWTAKALSRKNLELGKPYTTQFTCEVDKVAQQLTLTAKVKDGTEPPDEPEKFRFGFDKIELSTRTVLPGGKFGMKVTCPTEVTATSASFVKEPEFKELGDEGTESDAPKWGATATFKKTLPSVVNVRITCAQYGSKVYSTKPGKKQVGNGSPTVPKGAPDTGDGTMSGTGGNGGGALYAGGSAALVAAAGLGGLALRRRAARSAAKENA
ncbi:MULTISPECIES: hypothetical protein [Actinomadura]|uniref:LPXTG cell wall anchor domain-containing protein n=1 Tax=Actinomadura yumaensis TaxID=111807 RepID=A0ABW2CTF7_9ACTN|nr:hypothetical protein [Actinomadura sp. J1-007]MWK37776.1 hypothetical protein [Actinomadura sp. J1-007]